MRKGISINSFGLESRRLISVAEILLVICMSFAIFSFNISVNAASVSAAPVCCEKTKTGEFCQYVDEAQCSGLKAPTTCEQTSFCKPGCCFDKEGDGFCYANYGRAMCGAAAGVFNDDTTCNTVPECAMGCCLIGNQAVFTTEVKCKKETANYPDLKMDFRSTITTESECVNLVRTEEKGCCVTGDGACSWTTRGSCKVDEAVTGGGNASQLGFHKDKYCSKIGSCSCAPANPTIRGGTGDARSTICLDSEDSVYWKDSCGNPEGVKQKCDYGAGSLCGDPGKDGKLTCISTACQSGKKNDILSMNLKDYFGTKDVSGSGVLNGESWCQYDTKGPEGKAGDAIDDVRYHARDTAGSRYYRSICINGKELVEPCADFRQEFCVSDILDVTPETGGAETAYTEAKCIKNRGQSCIDQCNTADAAKKEGEDDFRKAQEDDFRCCTDISKRDCSWVGKCVPKVSLGFKFWENEGSDTCGKANMECQVLLRCGGWNKLVSYLGAGCDWQLLEGSQCFDQDFLQAANNICRSYGDCGANYNYKGVLTRAGFTNTPSLGEDIDKDILSTLQDAEAEEKIVLGSGSYAGDDFKALRESQLKAKTEAAKKGLTSPPDKDEKGTEFVGSYRRVPGYLEKEPDWDKGYAYFDYREPLNDEGKWKRLFGVGWGEHTAAQGYVFDAALIGIAATTLITGAITGLSAGGTFGQGATAFIPFTGQWNFLSLLFGNTYFSEKSAMNALTAKTVEEGANKELQGMAQNMAGDNLKNEVYKKGLEKNADVIMNVNAKMATQGAQIDALATKGAAQGVTKEAVQEQVRQQILSEEVSNKALEQAQQEVAAQQSAGGFGTVVGAVNTIMWAYMVYQLVDVLLEDTKTETIKVECKPWIQPVVTSDCERCNPDYNPGLADGYVDKNEKPLSANALKACSEYRCKALGATCTLLNQGTGNETCISISPYDVTSPVIKPWIDGFSEDYKDSVKETGGGMAITKTIPIYNNVRIAIKTNEPSQCKMSWNHSKKFNDMEPFYFGTQNYVYYHMQTIWVPGAGNSTESALSLMKGGGNYTIYVRCQDGGGNANEKDYSVSFNVGPEKDITAPKIEGSSIAREAFLVATTNKTDITLFVNEIAGCRWSLVEQEYDKMPAANLCTAGTSDINAFGNYNCAFEGAGGGNKGPAISGIKAGAGETKNVYFRCKDMNKNVNRESYIILLKGSNSLNITSVRTIPSIDDYGNIVSRTGAENVTLEVVTSNGAMQDGTSLCRYSWNDVNSAGNINMMTDTVGDSNSSVHSRIFTNLGEGKSLFNVGCIDAAGNTAFGNITINVIRDLEPPQIIRVYRDTQTTPAILRLDVNERSSCLYSTEAGKTPVTAMVQDDIDGKKFSVSADQQRYYVQCEDGFGNKNSVVSIVLIDSATGTASSEQAASETTTDTFENTF